MLYFLQQYFGLGGELYDPDGKPGFFNSPNREKLIAVFDIWRDFVVRGLMPAEIGAMTEIDERSYFYSGQSITVGSSTSFTNQMNLDLPETINDLSVVGMPMPSGHKPVPLISNWGYCLLAKVPERAEAAKEYIRYMVSADTLSKTNAAQGQLPVRRSIWQNSPAFSQGQLMKALYNIQNDPALRTASGVNASYPDIGNAIAGQVANVVAGKITSSAAVDNAGKEAMDAYQRLDNAK
jgi:ABC-type glycerol-3-phosphate transport system substrate-binding protein